MIQNTELTHLIRTCHACPSQWDAWDKDKNYYYIRYRHGILTVDKASSISDWWDDSREHIFREIISENDDDGMMSDNEMLELTGMSFNGNVQFSFSSFKDGKCRYLSTSERQIDVPEVPDVAVDDIESLFNSE